MIKIFGSINEWKESTNYMFDKWFHDIKKTIENWFQEDSFNELEFNYFEYDSSNIDPIYIGFLYFNENETQWKLQIIIDGNEYDEDDTIEEMTITLDAYDHNTDQIGTIKRTIDESEFVPDLLIELISEFKSEFYEENEDENIEEII